LALATATHAYKSATVNHTVKRAACAVLQSGYESAFCAYNAHFDTHCSVYNSCFNAKKSDFEATEEMVKILEKTHKSLYVTAKHVLCLVEMLELGNVTKMKKQLDICTNTTVSTAPLEVTYGSVPPATTCNAHAPTSKPCDAVWVKEQYSDKAWFGDAPTEPCLPCVSPTTTTTTATISEPTLGQRIPVAKFDRTNEAYVSIDASGNIYLGLNGDPCQVVKFNTADQQVWAIQIKHISLQGIVADDQGNSFVGGQVHPHRALDGQTELGSGDFGVIKLDTNGQIVWNRQIGSSNVDLPFSIALDHNGNILQTGYGSGNFGGPNKGFYDGNIAKYDSNGQKLWARNVGTPKADNLFGVAADASGNIFTVGTTSKHPRASATLVKLAPDGQELFFKENAPRDFQQFRDVCIDAVGFAYAAGFTWNIGGTLHALVMKFDNDGNQIWTKVLEAVQSTDEVRAWKISCAIPGAVMVGGWTKGTMDSKVQYLGGDRDFFVTGLDSTTGNQLWLKQFGTDDNDYFYSLDSKSGRTVMSGRYYPSVPYVPYLARLE